MNLIEYDSISDKLMWFNNEFFLAFTVKLARKDREGNRSYFHREYSYPSQYPGVENAVSIKRYYDYFLSIESLRDKYVYIQIRVNDMIMLKSILSNIVNRLLDDSQWVIKNERLHLKGSAQPLVLPNLVMNKWISFECTPLLDLSDSWSKGVRIGLSDQSRYIDVNIDQFMGFVYIIDSFNMVQQSAIMINYLNTNIIGMNRSVSDDTSFFDKKPEPNKPKEKRTIQNANKPFFEEKLPD